MHIAGATPGTTTYALGQALLAEGTALGAGGTAETIVGGAIINGFDDSNAGALEALGGTIGIAIGGLPGAAVGAAIGYAIGGPRGRRKRRIVVCWWRVWSQPRRTFIEEGNKKWDRPPRL